MRPAGPSHTRGLVRGTRGRWMGCLNQKCDVDLSRLGRRMRGDVVRGGVVMWKPSSVVPARTVKICKLLMLWPRSNNLQIDAPTKIANIVEKNRRYSRSTYNFVILVDSVKRRARNRRSRSMAGYHFGRSEVVNRITFAKNIPAHHWSVGGRLLQAKRGAG